ncbi:hypothetical protein FRB99_006235 [Tulasnella sp. 403]|nr:hypothetical protein FRB99_006235 [Tulasnella sp. 403]
MSSNQWVPGYLREQQAASQGGRYDNTGDQGANTNYNSGGNSSDQGRHRYDDANVSGSYVTDDASTNKPSANAASQRPQRNYDDTPTPGSHVLGGEPSTQSYGGDSMDRIDQSQHAQGNVDDDSRNTKLGNPNNSIYNRGPDQDQRYGVAPVSGPRPTDDSSLVDDNEAIKHATSHAGDQDNEMMMSALQHAKKQTSQQPIDEDSVQQAHQVAYQDGNSNSLDASSLGSAAALQAMQGVMGSGSSGGDMKSQLLGIAMAEAGKLFDAQGSASGNKQDAINGAAQTAMQLLLQDKFINLGKEAFGAYQASQQSQHSRPAPPGSNQPSQQGGGQYQPTSHGAAQEYYDESNAQLRQGGNSDYNQFSTQIDHGQAVQNASQHAGGQDPSLFATALQHLGTPGSTPSLDHDTVENAHSEAYRKGNAGSLDANSMGGAAAMQAFKMFVGGGHGSSSASGGGGQTQLLSMAMAEAAKLFDAHGGASSGSKQDAINGAAKTVMKLILQSKMGGGSSGGGSGSMGSLMGMASKFIERSTPSPTRGAAIAGTNPNVLRRRHSAEEIIPPVVVSHPPASSPTMVLVIQNTAVPPQRLITDYYHSRPGSSSAGRTSAGPVRDSSGPYQRPGIVDDKPGLTTNPRFDEAALGGDRARAARADLGEGILQAIKDEVYFTADNQEHRITQHNRMLIAGTKFYSQDDPILKDWNGSKDKSRNVLQRAIRPQRDPSPPPSTPSRNTIVEFKERPTLAAARYYAQDPKNSVGILNFASATRPGGGFLNGAQAQEESLARASNLYHSLTQPGVYQKFYAAHLQDRRDGFYTSSIILSKGVVLMRDERNDWVPPLSVDVVTSAAVNAGLVRHRMQDYEPQDVEAMILSHMYDRMGKILRLFEENNNDVLILGSFGTGVFQNSVSAVATIWANLLELGGRFHNKFSRVEFAILGTGTFTTFQKAYLEARDTMQAKWIQENGD